MKARLKGERMKKVSKSGRFKRKGRGKEELTNSRWLTGEREELGFEDGRRLSQVDLNFLIFLLSPLHVHWRSKRVS